MSYNNFANETFGFQKNTENSASDFDLSQSFMKPITVDTAKPKIQKLKTNINDNQNFKKEFPRRSKFLTPLVHYDRISKVKIDHKLNLSI